MFKRIVDKNILPVVQLRMIRQLFLIDLSIPLIKNFDKKPIMLTILIMRMSIEFVQIEQRIVFSFKQLHHIFRDVPV